MHRQFFTVIMLFLSILIAGCSGSSSNCNQTYGGSSPAPAPVQQKQRVVVRVVYPDGSPITGVQIFSDNPNVVIHNAFTDANGYYTFEISVPPGEHFNLTFVKDHFVIASIPGVIDGSGTPLEDGVTTLYNFQTVGYLPFSRDVNYHVTSVVPSPGRFCTYCNGIVAIPISATPKANTEPLPYLGNGFYLLNNTIGGQAIGKMDNCGNWTLFAGKPSSYGTDDGIGENARFQYLYSATISSDGAWLYVTDNDRIRKINTATREVTTLKILEDSIRALTISSDDKYLYTATYSNGIAKVDTSTGVVSYLANTASLSGYSYSEIDVKFSPDNTYLYIYTVGTIYKYEMGTQVVSTLISGLTDPDPVTGNSPAYYGARTMLVSGDGNTLYINHGASIASVDVSTKAITHLAGNPYVAGMDKSDGYAPDLLLNYPLGITMTRSGTIIILGAGLHYVYSYDIATKQITTLMGGNDGSFHGFYEGTIGFFKFGNVNDISMTSDSKKVFVASSVQDANYNTEHSIIQYDIASGVTTTFMNQSQLDAASGLSGMQPYRIAVSYDNKYIYIMESYTGAIFRLEIASKTISSIATGVSAEQMIVSPDGNYLYFYDYPNIKRIVLQTAQLDIIYSPPVGAYMNVFTISPDGSALYISMYDSTLSKYIVRKIDTSDLSVSLVSDGTSAGSDPAAEMSSASAMTVSTDGAMLYLNSDYKVIGIDIASGDTFMVANPSGEHGNRDGSGDIATFMSIQKMIMPNDGRYILLNDASALKMIYAVP